MFPRAPKKVMKMGVSVLMVMVLLVVFFRQTLYIKEFKTIKDGVIFTSDLYNNLANAKSSRRINIFFGTRLEIIKVGPIITQLKKSKDIYVIAIFTGQNSDIIQALLKLYNVHVDIWFENIMQQNQSISEAFGKTMLYADKLVFDVKSDIWVIQGDTTSALAIALTAFHKNIQVAHLDAGLRTYNMYSSFPEEFNRKTISSIATYNFAPTKLNVENLLKEGIDRRRTFLTGNTVIDATKYINENNLVRKPVFLKSVESDSFALLTVQRRENFNRIQKMYNSIAQAKCTSCVFIIPVHTNPSAGEPAKSICERDGRFLCVPPIPYQELHWIMKYAKVILTDSDGIQEAVTYYNTPTLILRTNTERPESVQSVNAKIVMLSQLSREIDSYFLNKNKTKLEEKQFPYGRGDAAKAIANILTSSNIIYNDSITNIFSSNSTSLMETNLSVKVQSEDKKIKIINKLKKISNPSISVVVQVYKRNSLAKQLESLALQTLKPKSVVIFQNEFHVNISGKINEFRNKQKDIEVVHISSSKNLRYHGRFHIAYLQTTDYVSVWDDDVYAESEWLEYSVQYSKSNGYGLIGANCRNFEKIDTKTYNVIQSERTGKCDFVGHVWTLPREFLIFYLEFDSLTYVTGEDVQLSFALQKQGIGSYNPPNSGARSVKNIKNMPDDMHASWLTINPSTRMLLFCSLLLQGFEYEECENCHDREILRQCVDAHKTEAQKTEIEIAKQDYIGNSHVWS